MHLNLDAEQHEDLAKLAKETLANNIEGTEFTTDENLLEFYALEWARDIYVEQFDSNHVLDDDAADELVGRIQNAIIGVFHWKFAQALAEHHAL